MKRMCELEAFERQREMATGGVAVEPRKLQATVIQGFSLCCRKSRGDLAAQESQKVSVESLFDLIVTVERWKKIPNSNSRLLGSLENLL